MKTLKYIFALILVLGTFHSCLVDNETRYDLNASGKNLAGFELIKTSVAAVADGAEYTFPMKVKVVGPTIRDLKSDITLTIAADLEAMDAIAEKDTTKIAAIAGVHYRIDDPTIVLKANNNYLGLVNVTMVTTGLVTPLPKTPVLVLKTVTATGDTKVTNNAKNLEITMNFACYANFAGTYNVHTVIRRAISGAVTSFDVVENITNTGIGVYRTQYVGIYAPDGTYWTNTAWAAGGLDIAYPGFTAGFTFTENCGSTDVPEQYMAEVYGNIVIGTAIGTANITTGKIHIEYSVSTSNAAGYRLCTSDYTRISK